MRPNALGLLDYVIFALTLGFSTAIGIYFGFFRNKPKSARQYLYGSGQMKALPIGMSLYSSAVSAAAVLGIPTEVYVFGSQYIMVPIGCALALVCTCYFILPVFCGHIKMKSPYEYIELRFSYTVRLISSLMYYIHTLLYMPLVLYASTIAVSEATGVSLELCVAVIGGVCVFYTTAGGFMSVIWTDALQAVLIMSSCIFVLCRGANQVGGMAEVWRRSDLGHRIILFNMDPNPFERLTIWSLVLGACVWLFAHSGCTAGALQRYMALPSEKHARMGCAINILATSFTQILCCIIGFCMYALYYNCDPVTSQKLKGYNQMVPYFVEEIVENLPGFYGFFTAGILSAGLSTLSAEMNTVGGFLYYDIIRKVWKKPLEPSREALIIKILVLLNGLYYLIAAPQFQKTKYIMQVAITLAGVTYGVKAGVLVLGTTFPKCNSKGVICGIIAGVAVVSWISIGALIYDVAADYVLPMSTNCLSDTNHTLTNTVITNIGYNLTSLAHSQDILPRANAAAPWSVYKLSFMYFPVLGLIITMLVALAVSYMTTPNDVNKMDPNLFIPSRRPGKKTDWTAVNVLSSPT